MLPSAFRRLFRPTLLPQTACVQAMPDAGRPIADALADMPVGQPCRVAAIAAPQNAPDWERWLGEIGFIPGEPATVTARSPWGDGALVVRIGSSHFALRRAEAACVTVTAIG
jgi:ferrous iron transport protein A